jgi:hypothetical protein
MTNEHPPKLESSLGDISQGDDGDAVLQPLPSLAGNFPDLITNGAVYVDKTYYIRKLLTDRSANSIFLSRPRRFGKTILVSTIEAVLHGRKELFKGCEISKVESSFKWEKSHVIHLDMSICGDIHDNIEEMLAYALHNIAELYDIRIEHLPSHLAIEELVKKLNNSYKDFPLIYNLDKLVINGKEVHADCPEISILIDEYDFPLISNLLVPKKLKFVQETLSKFYTTLKRLNQSRKLRLIFVTGITRFKELLWQSGMNAIEDVSFNPRYSSICGFSIDEIRVNFKKHISDVYEIIKHAPSTRPNYSIDDLFAELENWYDGYSWDGENRVLNPHSVLQFFKNKSLAAYWYATGSSSFLKQLNIHNPDYFRLYAKNLTCEEIIDGQNIGSMSATTALLMTGYLTVKKFIFRGGANQENQYILGIPNTEVMTSFANEHLIDSLFGDNSLSITNEIIFNYKDFSLFLSNLHVDKASQTLCTIFAIIPHQHLESNERFFQKEISTALMFFKGRIIAERSISGGDSDLVLETTGRDVFVVEIKYNKTATYTGLAINENDSPRRQIPEDPTVSGATGEVMSLSSEPSFSQSAGPGREQLAKTAVEQEQIQKLLDRGVKDAFNQIFYKGYAKGFISPRYKVYAIAISIVNRSDVSIDCREVTYGDWRDDPRPEPLRHA